MMESNAGLAPASAPGYGVTWGGPPRAAARAVTVAAAAALIAGMAGPAVASTASGAPPVSVIVQELPGSGDVPEKAVASLGGSVVRSLDVIDGFEARLPGDRLGVLRGVSGVRSVTENATLTLSSAAVDEQAGQAGSLRRITHEMTGAATLWDAGYTGAGVDVAVIDSGVVPVDGLRTPGKVVHGPDLSFEAMVCDHGPKSCVESSLATLDTYGHGTHMAGIIAGRDDDAPATVDSSSSGSFVGVAPDARIVSVKVADALGRTDVSQAIAAIDWVIRHKDAAGMKIRVLNLSFGTDGIQHYQLDPLAYAAEQAWHAGIVVVVSAGNRTNGTEKLDNPAYDPYVIAVGGSDGRGTATTEDDVVPSWSAVGDGTRDVDVVAPGQSVVALRSPGSYLDGTYPEARVGERFFRGSGTSQAAAVVSGAAALLLEQRPELTPDQVKALLMGTARNLPTATAVAQGGGLIDLAAAKDAPTPDAVQTWERAQGTGSLDQARGSAIVEDVNGVPLRGETTFTGEKFDAKKVAQAMRHPHKGDASLAGLSWKGLSWKGLSWKGLSWKGLSWKGLSWKGLSWRGLSWKGLSWRGLSWRGVEWTGLSWRGLSWKGLSWKGLSWRAEGWS